MVDPLTYHGRPYTYGEQWLHCLFTAPSMLTGSVCVVLTYRLRDYYNFYLCIMGIVFSMTYHTLHGFDIQEFLGISL